MPELELEPESHIYRLNGQVIPGCTQVLAAMGATPGFGWLNATQLEFYRSRGHAVASLVEYSVKGILDRRTVADEVKPHLIGWERAVNDLKIEVLELNGQPFAEVPLSYPAPAYGVKPDLVARIPAIGEGPIEIKATSAHSPATGLQLGAQLRAVREVLPGIGKMRVGLRLLSVEPFYDFRVYDDPSDEGTWLSLLNTYYWLRKHKLLKEKR